MVDEVEERSDFIVGFSLNQNQHLALKEFKKQGTLEEVFL